LSLGIRFFLPVYNPASFVLIKSTKVKGDLMNPTILRNLLHVVKGIAPADKVIRNGRLINVFTNTIEDGRIIVIKDGFIASVEDENGLSAYHGAEIIDADGRYLCPGFIDAHTHLDSSMIPFYEFAPYALRGGTTTVVTETSAAASSCGMDGVMTFVASTQGYPVRCYFLAPPLTPPFPDMESCQGLTLKQFREVLKRDDFVGIGEAYWTRMVEGDDRVLKQASAALGLGKALDGHAAGARGKRLIEYVLTGITSCHESTMVEEAIEKLRLGLFVMIREGWVRRELPELSKIKEYGVDTRRLILVSDVFDAVMLVEEGYLDSVVRRAVEYGFEPIEAIKMATINPADYYHLRHLGALAPLRKADMLFLDDLERVIVGKVMVDGQIVHEGGQFAGSKQPFQYPDRLFKTVHPGHVEMIDFKIKARVGKGTIRIIELANQTITKERSWELTIRDGYLQKDLENDIIPVAVLNRHNKGRMGRGFIKGTGVRDGALATTLIWDSGNILTLGTDEDEMARCVNRLVELGGGTVVSQQGTVIYECATPVYGFISVDSVPDLRAKIKGLEMAMERIGTALERPFLTIQTIPFTGLPFLRITDKGLADIKNKQLVPIYMDR
jgi:adenine deaminase